MQPDPTVRYVGLVCLLIATLTVLACAAVLPCLQPRSGRTYRLLGLAAIAASIMVWAARELDLMIGQTNPAQLFAALILTIGLVTGVCAAWVFDVIRQRLMRLEEETLLVALLLAALTPLLVPRWFPTTLEGRSMVTWFLHGVFWQMFCTRCIPPWPRPFPPRLDPIDSGVLDCHRPEADRHPRPAPPNAK